MDYICKKNCSHPNHKGGTRRGSLPVSSSRLQLHLLSDKVHLSGNMEWFLVQTLHAWHWCPSRLCIGAPSILPLYQISGLCNYITQLFLSLLRWWHSAISLFPFPWQSLIATHISECLADVSTWTTARHLRLNLNKIELLLMPGKDCPHMD